MFIFNSMQTKLTHFWTESFPWMKHGHIYMKWGWNINLRNGCTHLSHVPSSKSDRDKSRKCSLWYMIIRKVIVCHNIPHRYIVNVKYHRLPWTLIKASTSLDAHWVTGPWANFAAQLCPVSYDADHPRPTAVLELERIGSASTLFRNAPMRLQPISNNEGNLPRIKIMVARRHCTCYRAVHKTSQQNIHCQ
jgi:hypothetical protein